MSTVSLKMPDELVARLAAAARQRGSSRSAVVREALESYLAPSGHGEETAADLASDLIGSIEGPRDLSCSRRHMRGFGT